jgi:hypothetical protein
MSDVAAQTSRTTTERLPPRDRPFRLDDDRQ